MKKITVVAIIALCAITQTKAQYIGVYNIWQTAQYHGAIGLQDSTNAEPNVFDREFVFITFQDSTDMSIVKPVKLPVLETDNSNSSGKYLFVDPATKTLKESSFDSVQIALPAIALQGTKSSSTFNGTLLQTAYTVTHGLPYTPTTVIVQPRSANAAVPSWVSNITSTQFTINFASVPVVGVNNIVVDWIALK